MKRGTTRGDHHKRVLGHHIGPLHRKRDQHPTRIDDVDPITIPVPTPLHELQLLPEQRMGSMSHPHPNGIGRTIGIRRTRRSCPTPDPRPLNTHLRALTKRAYGFHSPMEARYAAKSAELAVTDRTIKRWVRSYRQLGVAGPGRIPPVLPAAWLEPLRAPALAASAPTPAKGTIG